MNAAFWHRLEGERNALTVIFQNVWVRVKRTTDSRALSVMNNGGRGTVSKTTSIHVRIQMDTGALFATTATRADIHCWAHIVGLVPSIPGDKLIHLQPHEIHVLHSVEQRDTVRER